MSKYQYVITAMKKLYDSKIVRSYTEMSQKLNVSRQYISQILIGRVKPSDEFIKSLLTTFPEIKSDLLKGHIELFPDMESTFTEAHEEVIKYNAKATTPDYKRVIPVVHYRAQAGFAEGAICG